MKIGVLIRVYNRTEDLICNLNIIRDTWLSNDYEIIVVSNGVGDGYILTPEIYTLSDHVIVISQNAGHLKGNSQLLLEGFKVIASKKYDFLVILESDTWLYSDKLIQKYTALLDTKNSVWASALWYDRFYSLATDFAIIKFSFLIDNSSIFDFTTYPECYVFNYLIDKKFNCIYIRENMNVQLPSYIKKFPFAPHGRFYSFPRSSMVTHHVEEISGGMIEKKKQFNIVSRRMYFDGVNSVNFRHVYFKLVLAHFLDKILIRRSWYSKRKLFDFNKSY